MDKKRTVGFTVKALSNQIKRYMDKNVTRNGVITAMQAGIIGYIGDSGGDVFQRDIELEFNVRRSTATGMLQLMERGGLIRRESVDHDARLKKVALTDKAREILEGFDMERNQMEAAMTAGINEEDLCTFYKVMEQIFDNIK